MLRQWLTAGLVLCSTLPLAYGTVSAAPQHAPASAAPTIIGGGVISQHALDQIDALQREAASRTPAQQRLDSNLLYESKMRRGLALADGVQTLRTGIEVDASGLVLVDMDADVTDTLLSQIKAAGGQIVSSFPQFHSIRARVPITQVETLAALQGIKFIKPAVKGMTQGGMRRRPLAPFVVAADEDAGLSVPSALDPAYHSHEEVSLAQREANVQRQLTQALRVQVGAKKSSGKKGARSSQTANSGGGTDSYANDDPEGDVAHRADQARAHYYVSGAGIKVGVLSDGVNSLSTAESNGDLPTVNVISGQAGSGDEGTAMLEIVHRLAPGAALDFATAQGGDANFANNIEALQADGCNIIVDDFLYFDESPFQDSTVARAVDYVTKNGVAYYSSAGNGGNVLDGTAANWEGDYVYSGTYFNNGDGNLAEIGNTYQDTASTSGSTFDLTLFWSDPLGASSNDYNLYVLSSDDSSIVSSSTNVQNGSQDPYEITTIGNGEQAVIAQTSGAAARFLHLQMETDGYGTLSIDTGGATRGHDSAIDSYLGYNGGIDGAFDVAATSAAAVYPGVFSTSDVVESFSSDGQRRVFYYSDGTPITSGNYSSSGGALLDRPNMTAADGVSTSVSGFSPFYGTSAAAPHAAAIAALIASDYPGIPTIYAGYYEEDTGIEIESGNFYDPNSGFGIVDAYNAVQLIAPYNDNFANSAALSGASGSTTGYNGGASIESGEPANAGTPNGRSVWYNWTSPNTGWFNFNTIGSNFDTTLGIYTGSAVNALTTITSDDDINTGGGDYQSSATFLSYDSGTLYDVSVDGYDYGDGLGARYGNIDLAWAQVAPPNDDFVNAQGIGNGASGYVFGNNQLATTESGEPNQGGSSVWFAWTAPYSGDFNFNTFGSNYDTELGVYTGSSVNALTQVAVDDDADSTLQSSTSFTAVGGTTYYLDVTGFSTHTGDIELNWLPLALNSVSVSPTSVVGGNSVTGTVYLNEDGTAPGTVVALSSNNAAVTVPASVTLSDYYAGNFTVNTSVVTTTTTATITATYNGVGQTTTLTVNPVPAVLNSVTASPTSVPGGKYTYLTVSLNKPATSTATITMSSSNPAVLSVQGTATIGMGYTSVTFHALTYPVTAATNVTITATYNGVSKTTVVTVTPPVLYLLTDTPTSITGGGTATLDTILSYKATVNATITLSSSNPSVVPVPASVAINAGYTSKTITLTSNAVTSATSVIITGTYNGVSKSCTLTVNPVALASVTATPTSVQGGHANTSLKVALTAKANATTTVTLTSSNSAALSVPATAVIGTGYQSVTVTGTSHAVASTTTVTVTAHYNGVTKTATVTVTH